MRAIVAALLLAAGGGWPEEDLAPYAAKYGGEANHVLPEGRGRVDVMTRAVAIDVATHDRWAEAVGYACYFREATGGQAGVILVVPSGRVDGIVKTNLDRCEKTCKALGLWMWAEPAQGTSPWVKGDPRWRRRDK